MLLESKMAQIRAQVHQRQQTWKKSFIDLNSEWTLATGRSIEAAGDATHGTTAAGDHADAPKAQRVRRDGIFQGKKTGGGGKRRSSLGHHLRELWAEYRQAHGRKKATKNERSQIMSTAHVRAKASEAIDPARWQAAGAAGTLTHRCGRASFGKYVRPPNRRLRKTPRNMVTNITEGDTGLEASRNCTALVQVKRDGARDRVDKTKRRRIEKNARTLTLFVRGTVLPVYQQLCLRQGT